MQIKLNTSEFQEMVAKATKGASADSNLYITQLMSVSLKENVLTLTTTDSTNYLYIRKDKVAGDDFSVVVPVEKFSKLISKLTCESVTLEVVEKDGELAKLVVKGNGNYSIELPYDEEGDLVEFPDPISDTDFDGDEWKVAEINRSTIQLILTTAKAALMTGTEAPQYTGYYCGDRIVGTDTYKICGIDIPMFDEAKLIPAELMNLLELMTVEKIAVNYNDDTFLFATSDVEVYGHTLEGIEDFQIEPISALLDEQFESSCKVEKSALLQMLGRISLFVDVFDKNSVYLTFTKDGLEVSSKQDSGAELIPYKESQNFKAYTCCLDIELFKTQVKASPSDLIEILYGKENSIKFVDGTVKQILALADDDRLEGDDEN